MTKNSTSWMMKKQYQLDDEEQYQLDDEETVPAG